MLSHLLLDFLVLCCDFFLNFLDEEDLAQKVLELVKVDYLGALFDASLAKHLGLVLFAGGHVKVFAELVEVSEVDGVLGVVNFVKRVLEYKIVVLVL